LDPQIALADRLVVEAVKTMQTVSVLGAGSWGTALAVHLARTGHVVRLWGRDAALIAQLVASRENAVYLPGVTLPAGVEPCAGLRDALDSASMVVAAVPSHGLRSTLGEARAHLPPAVPIVSTVKGLEQDTLLRMSEVIAQQVDSSHPIVVLSGPSFAMEFARELPTVVSVASASRAAAEQVQHELRSRSFRLYVTHDVTGVEIGGALKNVIAIAAGVVESLGLGHNAMAALMTRGLAEISRLAIAMGGRRDTLAGLSGLGDLVLTCTGQLSRNRQVGVELGRGRSLEDILTSMRMVAEGVRTTRAALALGERHNIELPIAAQMAEVLAGRISPRAAVEELMLRPPRHEVDDVG
jgi:glycerol-3-phosphate dehydrogenase (NAD(P)+)